MNGRWLALTTASVAALLLAGCDLTPAGTAEPKPADSDAAFLIHIENRSDLALTVGPGLSIAACGSTSVTRIAFDTAREAAGQMAVTGETWDAPAGALVWDMAIGFELTDDLTVVISGTAPLAVSHGVLADQELPPCGGDPVGIEPGLPQGETVTVMPLP